MVEEEFDLEDLKYYISLDAKQKLDYLEEMNLFLLKITPPQAVLINRQLEDEGY